jgi:hypothetical protein
LRGWGVGSVDERHFCDYCDNSGWQCCDERGGGDEEDGEDEEQTPPTKRGDEGREETEDSEATKS